MDVLVLKGHGIATTSFDFDLQRAPLEKPEDPVIPPSVLEHSESEDEEEDASSEASTPVIYSSRQYSWSEDTDGNCTGRSSIFSWANNDEFDVEGSNAIRNMFTQIDNCLFEKEDIKDGLNEECSNWNTSFPYLRLVGHQLDAVEDCGTQAIPTDQTEHLEDIDDIDDFDLHINGKHMDAQDVNLITLQNGVDSLSFLEEEIFAQHGEIEEFIAFDYSQTDESYIGNNPPPKASIHDIIISECFDHIWNKVSFILADVMELYTDVKSQRGGWKMGTSYDMERFLDSAMEFHQRENRHPPTQAPFKTPSTGQTIQGLKGLRDLMTIRPVPLKERASVTNTLREDDFPTPGIVSRPVSSSIGQFRQFPKQSTFRNAEQQFYDRMNSAKAPNKRINRLQPLQTPKTPNHPTETHEVGEVRGTRLQTAGERAASTIHQYWSSSRNGILPPLDRLTTSDTTYSVGKTQKRNRASSAVTNQKARTERSSYTNISDNRPNTMHSYRTDVNALKQALRANRADHLLSSSRSLIYAPATTIDENGRYLHPTSTILKDDAPPEVDDFVLWGHGPPLLSQKKKHR